MGLLHAYFASTVKGLEPVLASELSSPAIGAIDVHEGRLGVHFSGPPEVGARAVLWARSSLKIMELLGSGEGVHTSEDLYEFTRDGLAPPHRWEDLIQTKSQTISVQAVLGAGRAVEQGRQRPGDWRCPSCQALVFASKVECFRCGAEKPYIDPRSGSATGGGQQLTHSRYSALTVKNAVCDHLRDLNGWRPSVDPDEADVPLFLHVNGLGTASLYRLLSGGQSMHKRGYRTGEQVHVAALRETLAAGLLLHANYDPEAHVLCDPMAGSGTIPIEAALIATRTAPGLLRSPPPLARWDSFAAAWHVAAGEARDVRLERAPLPILANDWHGGALELARRAARAGGVDTSITFSQAPAEAFAPSTTPDLVVTNPPWDGRLEGGEESWTQLRTFLKRSCGGSTAWVLSGNKALTQHLRMRAASRLRIESSGTDLALLAYDVLRPRAPVQGKEEGERRQEAQPAVRGNGADDATSVTVPSAGPKAKKQESQVNAQSEQSVSEAVGSGMAVSVTAEQLSALSRSELQARAKEAGVKANLKSAIIIQELLALAESRSAATAVMAAASPGGTLPRPVSKKPKDRGGGPAQQPSITVADGTGRNGEELEGLFEGLYG